MVREFIRRKGNGFSSCYMCASKNKYSNEWDSSLYTDTKYGLPICNKCMKEIIKHTEYSIIKEKP